MKRLISPSPLPHLTRLVWIDHVLAEILDQAPEHGELTIKIANGYVQREAKRTQTLLVGKGIPEGRK